ncbi:MAG: hypothetical protein U0166_09085 [Acidobacteriota bacterium]
MRAPPPIEEAGLEGAADARQARHLRTVERGDEHTGPAQDAAPQQRRHRTLDVPFLQLEVQEHPPPRRLGQVEHVVDRGEPGAVDEGHLARLRPGERPETFSPPRHAHQVGVVQEHQRSIPRRAQIALDPIGVGREGGVDARDRVLEGASRRAPVAEDEHHSWSVTPAVRHASSTCA